jgi:hypothetical protein
MEMPLQLKASRHSHISGEIGFSDHHGENEAKNLQKN